MKSLFKSHYPVTSFPPDLLVVTFPTRFTSLSNKGVNTLLVVYWSSSKYLVLIKGKVHCNSSKVEEVTSQIFPQTITLLFSFLSEKPAPEIVKVVPPLNPVYYPLEIVESGKVNSTSHTELAGN